MFSHLTNFQSAWAKNPVQGSWKLRGVLIYAGLALIALPDAG